VGRRAAGLIAFAIAVVLSGPVLADVAGSWEFHDLWCFYHGGTAVIRGLDPYDGPAWTALTADPGRVQGDRVVKTPCPGAFAYPYWSALAFVPLALLPYAVAAGIWGMLLIGGVIAGIALVVGQLTGVLLPLLCLPLIARPARAGSATAMLALKPQLAGLYAIALLKGASARFIWSAAITLLVLGAASIAVFPAWPGEWLRELTTNRVEIARPLPTAAGLASLLFGDARVAIVLVVALIAAVVILGRGRRIDRVTYGAIAIAVSLFAVPYAYTYDQLFLLLPWAVVAAAAARAAGPDRWLRLAGLVGAAILVPWAIFAATFATGSDTYNAVVPALAALLATVSAPRGETMGA